MAGALSIGTAAALAISMLTASGGMQDVDETRAGRVGGAAAAVRVVDARSMHVWNETFRGGELAIVSISGDGDTDLDLYVYDQRGNLIERSISYGDDESVSWVPAWTGSFRIEVRNHGGVWNRYAIVTN